MSNTLTNLFQTKVVPGLYNKYYAGLTSGWMENNAIGVEYRGGKYVTMHELGCIVTGKQIGRAHV